MSRIDFGVMLRQQKIEYSEIRDTARLCDELGYHSVWLYDHILGMGGIDVDIYEAWTLMTALAEATERIKVGTMVLCNSFRPPALLAKMAATLDVISGGRLEFAIGAGWFEAEYKAYGYSFADNAVRVEQLREAIQIVRAMWTEEKPSFEGKHYRIDEAYCNPKPLQKPRPAILLGGAGEKYMLPLVAELADEWNCPATQVPEFDHKLDVLKRLCSEAGRDISEIGLSQQTVCVLAKDEAEYAEKLPKAQRRYGFFGDIETLGIVGTPEQCIEKIKRNEEKGVKKYTIFFSDVMNQDTIRFFAEEVMSAFE